MNLGISLRAVEGSLRVQDDYLYTKMMFLNEMMSMVFLNEMMSPHNFHFPQEFNP